MLRIVDNSACLPMRVIRWHVAFWREVHRPLWIHRLARGPYKHVSAMGYSARCNVWVVYNPDFDGEGIRIVSNDETFLELLKYTQARADLLVIDARPRSHSILRPGLYCVPQIIRLTGVRSSALTPTGLFRDCMRAGAIQSSL